MPQTVKLQKYAQDEWADKIQALQDNTNLVFKVYFCARLRQNAKLIIDKSLLTK